MIEDEKKKKKRMSIRGAKGGTGSIITDILYNMHIYLLTKLVQSTHCALICTYPTTSIHATWTAPCKSQ